MNRFDNIQALRGIACLIVVCVHVAAMEGTFGYRTRGLDVFHWFGFAGVDLFFVISGFIIAITNRNAFGSRAAIPGYLFRRLWRVYPAYWVAMGIAVAVGYARFQTRIVDEITLSEWASWLSLYAGTGNRILGQAWTLTYEVMFYLVFGAVLFFSARVAAFVLGVWGLAVLVANVPASRELLPLQAFVLEFLSGCGIAWLATHGVRRFGRTALVLGFVWAVVGILIVNATRTVPYALAMCSHRDRVLVFGPAAALIVYGAVSLEGVRRVPRVLLRLGDASYAIYLLHIPVIAVATHIGYFIPHSKVLHLCWLLGSILSSLLAGYAFHRLVEQPLLNVVKRRKNPAPERRSLLRFISFPRFTWRR